MKRLVLAALVICTGCAAGAPIQGPVESPHTPLVVLENSGQTAGQVNDHYDEVNRLTDKLFEQP